MKIIFLGTNGWYDTTTGNTICTLLETENYYIVLDAGNGLYKLDEYINNSEKPIYLFLSHFHLDHVEGLHILNKFNFKNILRIYGQPGTRKILKNIINQPYTVPFLELPFEVHIHEIGEGIHYLPFKVESKFLPHASPCLGYRFDIDGKVISYCTDTGPHKNVEILALNANLLITECSLKMGASYPGWPHLNPLDAVEIAIKSQAKALALTHFDANVYRSREERLESKESMEKLFQNITYAHDGMKIEL
ncbi:MAG: ribonuclease Z [Methanobacteriaceae archaeon]